MKHETKRWKYAKIWEGALELRHLSAHGHLTSAQLARRDCGRVLASTCLCSQEYGHLARNVMEKGWAKIRIEQGKETEKEKSEENESSSTEDVQRQEQGEQGVQDKKEEVTRGKATTAMARALRTGVGKGRSRERTAGGAAKHNAVREEEERRNGCQMKHGTEN